MARLLMPSTLFNLQMTPFSAANNAAMAQLIFEIENPSLAATISCKLCQDLQSNLTSFIETAKEFEKIASKQSRIYNTNIILKLQQILAIYQTITRTPNLSVSTIASITGISEDKVDRLLKANLKKIKLSKQEENYQLKLSDCDRRFLACQYFAIQIKQNENYSDRIVFSDEAIFHTDGSISPHNCRWWSKTKPNFTQTKPIYSQKIIVWCAMYRHGIIGPYFFTQDVDGPGYLTMLKEFAIPEMQELGILHQCLFQQDGCPIHYTKPVISYLTTTFKDRWIGRAGVAPITWPVRSPDLTPLDFYLWGYLKQRVYKFKNKRNLKSLKCNIQSEVAQIPRSHFDNVYNSFKHRIEKCIDAGGGQFEK